MAADPAKVFSRDELARAVWRSPTAPSGRTIESHICRLRRRLTEAGATDAIINCWGRVDALIGL